MAATWLRVRATRDEDRSAVGELFAAVAVERNGIATEPPVDVEARAAAWKLEGDFVAEADGRVIGTLHVEEVGTALVSWEWPWQPTGVVEVSVRRSLGRDRMGE